MQTIKKPIKQLFIIGLLITLVVAFSLCIGDDDDGNGEENGENGGNGGNGGNGNNNTTEVIKIIEVRQEPPVANMGTTVDILAKLESKYPIRYVNITICVDVVCFEPKIMEEIPIGSGTYRYSYEVPMEPEGPPEIKYTVKVTDSLGNHKTSEDYYLEVI